jgi:uncharacterized protein (DUF1697 family)
VTRKRDKMAAVPERKGGAGARHAIFLRAVNVGGKSVPVKALADALGLVNIQAAGTFVCADDRSQVELSRAIERALPFETDVIVRGAAELRAAVSRLGNVPVPGGAKRFLTLLASEPDAAPTLPIERPEDGAWEVRVSAIDGPFVLSMDRKLGERRRFYPNEVVERALGVPATTRGWDTITKVLAKLG